MHHGYYRFPTIAGDTIVFTSDDDLWRVPVSGGVPRRLTAGAGECTHGHLSPDGAWIAYTGREEGPAEVFVIPAEGGEDRRLTFLGTHALVVGWRPDGKAVYFATNARAPFLRLMSLWEVPLEGGEPRRLPWGPARHVSFAPDGRGVVVGRNTGDPARWKRYRGGTAGELWIDKTGTGRFVRLHEELGNPTSPMWIGDRIYFIADFEGVGNLYSCRPDGGDLQRQTDHEAYYARQATSDGRRIVYHAGADIYVFDPTSGESQIVPIEWHAAAPQRSRRFVDAARFLDGGAIHPSGNAIALTTRGKAFVMGAWAASVVQLGTSQGVRYRWPAFLPDGERIVLVHDAAGEERLCIGPVNADEPLEDLGEMDFGRVLELVAAPHSDRVAIANHRHELVIVDLAARTARVVDRSPTHAISGLAWSPDGAWLAYSRPLSRSRAAIFLAEALSGEVHQVTDPVLMDQAPSWDPEGRWLYFVSYRYFDPVYDNLHFDLGFPRGGRPCLVTLRDDVPSPFVPTLDGKLAAIEEEEETKGAAKEAANEAEPADEKAEPADEKNDEPKGGKKDQKKDEPKPIRLQLAGIARRVVPFPVPEGRYEQVLGVAGKVMFTSTQPTGAIDRDITSPSGADAMLEVYDFATQKREMLVDHVSWVVLDRHAKSMLLFTGERLRVVAAGEKPKDNGHETNRDTGWIELGRVRVDIDPRAEWRQMYREAWRLQRDQFWTEDMSSVDWQRVHDAYRPLLDRVASRAEFSDLLWEMQGELGTSHAYEWGGDYRPVPRYDQGQLGADFSWDEAARGWRIDRIVDGDPGHDRADSPLRRVGLGIQVGDVLVAVNGHRLDAAFPPEAALVHQARTEVALTFVNREGAAANREGAAAGEDGAKRPPKNRTVEVRTLASEWAARYREWVDLNRRRVHEATEGRCGYVHLPDMGPAGYAEFHRGWLAESEREALIVDVRNNGGGHVSQLILEKLARRRLGYDVPRWGRPAPYPDNAMAGPIVAITNEIAGSDGDIFSHCFKLMKLGPLIGKRTWGGVIGIWPRHALVDGTYTTQPEFSFWFEDVGWGVENYGTEPDIEVDIAPHDYAAGEDPQMARALAEIAERLAASPPKAPDLSMRPNLAPPKLPPRVKR